MCGESAAEITRVAGVGRMLLRLSGWRMSGDNAAKITWVADEWGDSCEFKVAALLFRLWYWSSGKVCNTLICIIASQTWVSCLADHRAVVESAGCFSST